MPHELLPHNWFHKASDSCICAINVQRTASIHEDQWGAAEHFLPRRRSVGRRWKTKRDISPAGNTLLSRLIYAVRQPFSCVLDVRVKNTVAQLTIFKGWLIPQGPAVSREKVTFFFLSPWSQQSPKWAFWKIAKFAGNSRVLRQQTRQQPEVSTTNLLVLKPTRQSSGCVLEMLHAFMQTNRTSTVDERGQKSPGHTRSRIKFWKHPGISWATVAIFLAQVLTDLELLPQNFSSFPSNCLLFCISLPQKKFAT